MIGKTGHRERVREKIAKHGVEGMHDYEILEFMLFSFVPRKDTKAIAKQLIAEFGSLRAVLLSSHEVLAKVPNMTRNASLFIASLPEIARRVGTSEHKNKPKLESLFQIKDYLTKLFSNMQEEAVYLLALDSLGKLKEQIKIAQGECDQCKISIKKLVINCVNLNSANVYIVHNHPVGNASPSVQDIKFTKWVKQAMEIMDINLVDHLIFSNEDIFSFRQNNML